MNYDPTDVKWVDLTFYWKYLQLLAQDRDKQKLHYRSTKNWSIKKSTHFVGLCGEMAFHLKTGLDIDHDLRAEGDPGYDFVLKETTYDIKGATFIKSPDLKEFPDSKKWADIYVLAAVDVPNKRARIIGWVTQEQLRSAPINNYGYGDMLSMSWKSIQELNQIGLPPSVKKETVNEGN